MIKFGTLPFAATSNTGYTKADRNKSIDYYVGDPIRWFRSIPGSLLVGK